MKQVDGSLYENVYQFVFNAELPPPFAGQMNMICDGLKQKMTAEIGTTLPDSSPKEVAAWANYICDKTAAFTALLTNGELSTAEDTARLVHMATATGLMYFSNHLMDRNNDAHMRLALNLVPSYPQPGMAAEDAQLDELIAANRTELNHMTKEPQSNAWHRRHLRARLGSLQNIKGHIDMFARPEDANLVWHYYINDVLIKEARLKEHALAYGQLTGVLERATYIHDNKSELAHAMVVDAGARGVILGLYACDRSANPSLPSVEYVDTVLNTHLHNTNAHSRLYDEKGDKPLDADPATFAINVFVQKHRGLMKAILQESGVAEPLQSRLNDLFDAYCHTVDADEQDKLEHGMLHSFTRYLDGQRSRLATELGDHFSTALKREWGVAKISIYNAVGDTALAG